MFTWLPLYKEIAQWILQYRNRQEELISLLKQVGFEKNLSGDGEEITNPVMDPFTFYASFQKLTTNRAHKLSLLKNLVGLKSEVPTDFNGLPSANAQGNVRYFPNMDKRGSSDLPVLWDLATQAVNGKLRDDTFKI